MSSSDTAQAPGGLSLSKFKSICADVSDWTWGMVQGAFNEKATFSQILVDAVIGMIPLVGDGTAVRDLIAVIMGLINDPKKRDEIFEWILLVVLVFALIPVVGGVVKGVGRILVKVFKEASLLTGAARAAKLMEGAQEIIAFLNRIGVKNAEQWLLKLRFAEYQAKIMDRFGALMDVLDIALQLIKAKAGSMIPASLAQRIDALRNGLAVIKAKGSEMIPKAIKELDQELRELQAYVRSGGQTTSRIALHEAATGERVATKADEARLVEDGTLPARSARGGWKQNPATANDKKSWGKYYEPEPDFPDLTKRVEDGQLPYIAAYSGRIVNRELKQGEEIFRLFGPGGVTHGVDIDPSKAAGAWWGLGSAPKSAKEWREMAGVLDEFNRDGFLVTSRVEGKVGPKAVVGTVSEQSGKKLPGQYLPGGATQAYFYLDKTLAEQLVAHGEQVVASGKPMTLIDPVSGMSFHIRPTGWTDANGIWGYLWRPGSRTVHTAKVAEHEEASKDNHEVVVTP